jgi:hypothetical protein
MVEVNRVQRALLYDCPLHQRSKNRYVTTCALLKLCISGLGLLVELVPESRRSLFLSIMSACRCDPSSYISKTTSAGIVAPKICGSIVNCSHPLKRKGTHIASSSLIPCFAAVYPT